MLFYYIDSLFSILAFYLGIIFVAESIFSVNLSHLSSYNSNSNSRDNVYGAVIVAVNCHCEKKFIRFIWSEQHERQAAADLWTRPIDLNLRSACRQLQVLH